MRRASTFIVIVIVIVLILMIRLTSCEKSSELDNSIENTMPDQDNTKENADEAIDAITDYTDKIVIPSLTYQWKYLSAETAGNAIILSNKHVIVRKDYDDIIFINRQSGRQEKYIEVSRMIFPSFNGKYLSFGGGGLDRVPRSAGQINIINVETSELKNYGTPRITHKTLIDGSRAYVNADNQKLLCYDFFDGEIELATKGYEYIYTYGDLVIAGDIIFSFGKEHSMNNDEIVIDHQLFAFNKITGEKLWSLEGFDFKMKPYLLYDNNLLALLDCHGSYYIIDPDKRKIVFSGKVSEDIEPSLCKPISKNGYICFYAAEVYYSAENWSYKTGKRMLYKVNISDGDYEIIHTTEEQIISMQLYNDMLFFITNNSLNYINLENNEHHKFDMEISPIEEFLIEDDELYIGAMYEFIISSLYKYSIDFSGE